MRNSLSENLKYIFYSVIGRHAGESVEDILSRKQEEVIIAGLSLWSAAIDGKSIEQVSNLNEGDRVNVLCKLSPKAFDPVKNSVSAKIMIYPNGEIHEIPDGIVTTYTEGKKYQAYVVKNYRIFDKAQLFDFGHYETTLKDGSHKSYKERFNLKQFQNTLGRYNEVLDETCKKEIMVVMELTYPFVVNIK